MITRVFSAVMLALVLAGCSESPRQRAERISQECAEVMKEIKRLVPKLSDTQIRDLVFKCVLDRAGR